MLYLRPYQGIAQSQGSGIQQARKRGIGRQTVGRGDGLSPGEFIEPQADVIAPGGHRSHDGKHPQNQQGER